MRCSECGANIREGSLYCDACGAEVRIVPDYSSLDEVLTAHVRGEIEGRERHNGKENRTPERRQENRTRKNPPRRKKKSSKKKKMLIILSILLAAMLVGFVVYQSSYGGYIQKGYNALEKKKYNAAVKYFNNAAETNREKADAYIGLSKVYIAQDNLPAASEVFLTQIANQPANADIYRAAAEFYMDTGQPEQIPLMLDACSEESVLRSMSDYIVETPKFSLEEGTYEELQKLELSSEGNTVYYTLDESEPTEKSGAKYGAEITLDEGEWLIRAVAVNEKGVPSLVSEKKIIVELPISDPPIVSPSSGLYESAMDITIQVEEGFSAYYVFGQTEPNPDNWEKYTGPIAMPEGNTIFSAVLVDDSTNKISSATVRNYDLSINPEENE